MLLQLPEAPTNAPVFLEDLPEDEQDHTGFAKYGAGKAPSNLQGCGITSSRHACCLVSPCLRQRPQLAGAAPCRPQEPGQHVLHEQHGAVPLPHPGAAPVPGGLPGGRHG